MTYRAISLMADGDFLPDDEVYLAHAHQWVRAESVGLVGKKAMRWLRENPGSAARRPDKVEVKETTSP